MSSFFLAGQRNLPPSKHGNIILFVILFAVLSMFLVFSYITFMERQANIATRAAKYQIADLIAESIFNLAVEALRFETKNQSSEIFKTLSGPLEKMKDTEGPINLVIYSYAIDELTAPYGGTQAVEIKAKWKVFKEDFANYPDPLVDETYEKYGKIWVTVETSFGGTRRELTGVFEVKTTCVLPKFASRFTLFIEQAVEDNNPEKYNVISIKGKPAGELDGDKKPLIIFNGAEDEPLSETRNSILKKRGWIYLGGKAVVLNISDGAGKYGEDFHFFQGNPALDPDGERWYEDGNFALRDFQILYYDFGYYKNLQNDEIWMDAFTGLLDSSSTNTSCLHLYGSASKPSPTLVLGNVYRKFVRLSAYKHRRYNEDPSCRGEGNIGFFLFKTEDDYEEYKNSLPVFKEPYLVNMPMDYRHYIRELSSRIVIGAYNESADFIATKNQNVDPPHVLEESGYYLTNEGNFSEQRVEYPPESMNLKVRAKLSTLLKDISPPEDYLAKKCAYIKIKKEESFEEFLKAHGFLRDSTLLFDSTLRVNGPVTIENMHIKRGGLIVVEEGDVTVRGTLSFESLDAALNIVALRGNIILALEKANEYTGSLVAPRGTLKLSGPLNLHGNLFVEKLDVDELTRYGGNITYSSSLRLDHTSDRYEKNMKVDISPVPLFID